VIGALIPESERQLGQPDAPRSARGMAYLLPVRTILCRRRTPFPAPLRGQRLTVLDPLRDRITCLVRPRADWPAIRSQPPGGDGDGLPVGLSIIGPRGSDATWWPWRRHSRSEKTATWKDLGPNLPEVVEGGP